MLSFRYGQKRRLTIYYETLSFAIHVYMHTDVRRTCHSFPGRLSCTLHYPVLFLNDNYS